MRHTRRSRILVDADGVLANFAQAVVDMVNEELGTEHQYDHIDQWDMYASMGISKEHGTAFDERIKQNYFCYGLAPIPGAVEGLAELRKHGDVYCVTAPFDGAYWMPERVQWLQDFMGFDRKHVVFTHSKHLVAGEVLIDDKAQNLRDWRAEPHAGVSILFDQPWNRNETEFSRAEGWANLVEMSRQGFGVT